MPLVEFVIPNAVKDLLRLALCRHLEIPCFAPKEVRHVEPCETSPWHQEIPHYVRDDGIFSDA